MIGLAKMMGNRYELNPLVDEKGYKITLTFRDRSSVTGYTIEDLNWKIPVHEDATQYWNGDNRWGVRVRWVERGSGEWYDGFILPDGTIQLQSIIDHHRIDRIDIKESAVFPIAL